MLKNNPFLPALGTLTYRRNQANQSKHNQMITVLAKRLDEQRLWVLADHIGWYRGAPQEIHGHVPDLIYWNKDDVPIIVEVETLDSCVNAHSISQMKSFNRVATTVVIIPEDVLSPFKRTWQLEELIRSNKLQNVQVMKFVA